MIALAEAVSLGPLRYWALNILRADSAQMLTFAVHPPDHPWSPRSQGFPREAASARPRLGGISFLHRFGSTLNHPVHLHACVTDSVFVPAVAEAACDTPPAFLPARPITHVHLAALGVTTKPLERRTRRDSAQTLEKGHSGGGSHAGNRCGRAIGRAILH